MLDCHLAGFTNISTTEKTNYGTCIKKVKIGF